VQFLYRPPGVLVLQFVQPMSYGGTQVMSRQTTYPPLVSVHGCVPSLQLPYRKLLQQVLLLPQLPFAHWHPFGQFDW
jgi:hypothetical protein